MNASVIQSKKSRKRFDKAFKQQRQSGHGSGRRVGHSCPKAQCLEDALGAAVPRGKGDGGAKRNAEQLEVENSELRRENDYLRQQRDILKKTLGILSEPPSNGFNGLKR